ncbi:MAG TPA: hypothetical protein PKW95_09635 [bacterium]|nr:hypothetical protein [bacterium]
MSSLRERLLALDEVSKLRLFPVFKNIEDLALRWITAMSDDGASHRGLTHIQNVERICNDIIFHEYGEIILTQAEIFILLSAVLLHDIGRMIETEKSEDRSAQIGEIIQVIKQKGIGREFFKDWDEQRVASAIKSYRKRKKYSKNEMQRLYQSIYQVPHPLFSYYLIVNHSNENGIYDNHIAEYIALVSLLHNRQIAQYFIDKHYIETQYNEMFGPIRIAWLAAILSLADEMDMSYFRTLPTFLSSPTANNNRLKAALRRGITGCSIQREAHMIVIHPSAEFVQQELRAKPARPKNLAGRFVSDVRNKKELIRVWWPYLKQMDLEIFDCRVAYKGHLLGLNDGKLQITTEPHFTGFKMKNVFDAMFRLRFGVFGKSFFNWKMLSNESGIQDVDQLKMIVGRLGMIAKLWNNPDSLQDFPHSVSNQMGTIRRMKNEFLNENALANCAMKIIPMDGEWTINIQFQFKKGAKQKDLNPEDIKENCRTVVKIFLPPESRD